MQSSLCALACAFPQTKLNCHIPNLLLLRARTPMRAHTIQFRVDSSTSSSPDQPACRRTALDSTPPHLTSLIYLFTSVLFLPSPSRSLRLLFSFPHTPHKIYARKKQQLVRTCMLSSQKTNFDQAPTVAARFAARKQASTHTFIHSFIRYRPTSCLPNFHATFLLALHPLSPSSHNWEFHQD